MGSFRVSHGEGVLLVNKDEKLGFSIIQNLNFKYTSTLDIYLIRILLFAMNLTQFSLTISAQDLTPFPIDLPYPATRFIHPENM